jgi:hypothetical protein
VGRKPRDVGLSIDEMVRRYPGGETCATIAAATGLAEATVHYRLKRAGVEFRPAHKAPGYGRLDLSDAEIAERYRAGESTYEIGRSLGVSANAIREHLIEAGVERRPKGTHRRPESRAKERANAPSQWGAKRRAVEEFLRRPDSERMTQQQIAQVCHVAQSYVSAIAKRLRAADHGA